MPTIHDLPLETIGHIITIAHPYDPSDTLEQRARRRFYRNASLVCRDWTPFAQRALWKYVSLEERKVGQFVESGGAGRYPIEKVNIAFVQSSYLGTFLVSVRGVRVLRLYGCSIAVSWLCGDNWRGKL